MESSIPIDPALPAVVPNREDAALHAAGLQLHTPPPRSGELVRALLGDGAADFPELREALREHRGLEDVGPWRRGDLLAASLMQHRGLYLNRERRIVGSIPGVSVGDAFLYRMELCVLGLHGQVQAGIGSTPNASSGPDESIATSGGYEDDEDHGDVLIYTGQGGRDRAHHTQSADQLLVGGNKALANSKEYGTEVRVIRAVQSRSGTVGVVYVYDGLYNVVDYWLDHGKSGFAVYKYRMVRLPEQDAMGSTRFLLADRLKDELLAVRLKAYLPAVLLPSGYLCLDISMGREGAPVGLYNDVDDRQDHMMFEYLPLPLYPPALTQALGWGGCGCAGDCSPASCWCAQVNGGRLPYGSAGVLLQGRPVLFECGPGCRCPPSCRNRVSQKGMSCQLEVFRSRETEWGVRTLDLIRAGTFVCELAGVVLSKDQLQQPMPAGRSLVYPGSLPPTWAQWGDLSAALPGKCVPPISQPSMAPDLGFAVDVSAARNVACYLSHSNFPNVFVQCVLFDHYNLDYPHLMIFALENIPPMAELSLDYGIDA